MIFVRIKQSSKLWVHFNMGSQWGVSELGRLFELSVYELTNLYSTISVEVCIQKSIQHEQLSNSVGDVQ